MTSKQNPSEPGRFPLLFLTVVALLTSAVLGWLGWNTYRSYQVTTLIRERLFRIQEMQGVITHLDEVLTMSARMAAATGDPAWEQRYLHFEPILDSAIQEVIRLEPDAYRSHAAETEAANTRLVEMEHHAFDLVREQRSAEARAILFSPEYETQKRVYSEGMEQVEVLLKKNGGDLLESEQRNAHLHNLAIIALLPLLGISWLFVLRTLHRWRSSLMASNRQLDEQARELARLSAERIREERAFSEAVIQGLPAIVCIFDEAGRFLRWNTKFEIMLGYSSAEVSEIGILDTVAPEHQEVLERTIRRVMEVGSGDTEASLLTRTGMKIPCYLVGVRLAVNGKPCLLGAAIDISKRRQAEEALRQSRTVLANVLDSVPQSIFWKDREGTYLGCNAVFAQAAGLPSAEAIVGKTDFDLPWPREEAEAYRADDAEVIQHNRAKCHIVEPLQQADGSRLWIDTSKVPLTDQAGGVSGVLGVYEDITERKAAENALRIAHNESELYFNSVPSILIGLDSQGRIGRWNFTAATTFGLSEAAVRGKLLKDCGITWLRADAESEVDSWLGLTGARRCDDLPFDKNGEKHFLGLTILPVNFASGEHAGLLITGADVTERKHLEEQLRQAQKLEAIGQLAAGIAHEINTPTQYVSDNATFLKESWPGLCNLLHLTQALCTECSAGCNSQETLQRVKRCLEIADLDYLLEEIPRAIDQSLQGLQHVAKIVRCMKEFSHPDSSSKALVDLNRAIETTITIARNEWKYVAEVVTQFDPSLPPVSCFVGEFNQVILNLIVNAADAIRENVAESQKGKITIATCQKGGFVEVSVSDTGGGIPQEIRSRIFELFFTTKEVGKGSGQGLALAHAVIVKKHAGKIWFETELGKGTTFFLQLPWGEAPSGRHAPDSQAVGSPDRS
jgi:PAS domain S-box-containing protein